MSATQSAIVFPCAKGLVFGTFDGFHPGHAHFLAEAASRCQKLVVIVAHPEMTVKLKHRVPKFSFEDRASQLRAFLPTAIIEQGDPNPGQWTAIKVHQPDCVFLGYDQTVLAKALEEIGQATHFLTSFHPDQYKSSLLNQHNQG